MTGVLVNGVEIFLLVFVRMTGLFVIAPIFGRRNIPTYFKIGFSFILALILINTIRVAPLDYYNSIVKFAFLVIQEFIVGLIIGYISFLVFNAIYIAGQLIDMQIGFGVVNVIDPMSNIQVPITANFYVIVATLIFLTTNGHHVLIRALFDSYKYIPPGMATFDNGILNQVVNIFGNLFMLGFKIAAPITAAILICDVALGVISKAVPQLNVFVVGMPLKIGMGIAILVITMTAFVSVFNFMQETIDVETVKVIKELGLKK